MGDVVGYLVGYAVGDAVGEAVGYAVGNAVGDDVGYDVGYAVGDDVGTAVGTAVGYGVGTLTQAVCDCLPSVHVLSEQAWHMWYPLASWYLPLGQWSQLLLAAQALYLPEAHEWHVLPEDRWYLPVGQSLHEVDSATAKRPLAHAVHEAALYTEL